MTSELDRTVAEGVPPVDQVIADVVAAVREKRGTTPVDEEDVRDLVVRECARYENAPVRTFLPVLVRRAVIDHVLGRG